MKRYHGQKKCPGKAQRARENQIDTQRRRLARKNLKRIMSPWERRHNLQGAVRRYMTLRPTNPLDFFIMSELLVGMNRAYDEMMLGGFEKAEGWKPSGLVELVDIVSAYPDVDPETGLEGGPINCLGLFH